MQDLEDINTSVLENNMHAIDCLCITPIQYDIESKKSLRLTYKDMM